MQSISKEKDAKQSSLYSAWGIQRQVPALPASKPPVESGPSSGRRQLPQQELHHSDRTLPTVHPARAPDPPGKASLELETYGFSLIEEGNDFTDFSKLVDCPTTTGGIKLCPAAAQTWVYPQGIPMREYQLSAIKSALMTNTLVCLPTGLGKTLVAAVVMHNFARWFPEVRDIVL